MMTPAPHPSAAAGAFARPFNAARWLQDIAQPLLPGRLVPRLQNAPVPPPRADQGLSRELRALCDGASSQMFSWGASIGVARLLQFAERLAPGISCPLVACQAFCALSDVARGNLLRAVQAMPMTALTPALLQQRIADGMRPFLPAGFATAGHQDLVMGLACCAALYELTRNHPVQTPRSAWAATLLQTLGRLRAALNVVGGLQAICNLPAADPHALAGARTGQAACTALLPGADAGGAKAKPVVPVRRRPQFASMGRPRPRFNVRRIPARQRNLGRMRQRHGPGGQSGPPIHTTANRNKESLLWPLPNRPAVRARPSIRDHYTRLGEARSRVQQPAGADVGRPDRRPPANVELTTTEPDTMAPATTEPTLTGAADPLPSCLHFHRLHEAEVQVKKLRREPQPVRFCVHDRARPAFEWMLEWPRPGSDDPRHWMVALPVHERYDPALREAQISKYSGLGQLQTRAPRNTSALGDDELFVVLTVSVVPDHRLHHLEVPGNQILPRNSFSLIEHTELDGDTRQFLVWFIHRPAGVARGTRAGFIEIERDDGNYIIADPETGFSFFSDNLDDLLAGVEKVSGCHFRPDADDLPVLQRYRIDDVPAMPTLNRFIGEAAAHTGGAPGMGTTDFNPELRFFEPVAFGHLGGHSGRLLPSCFTLVGQDLVAVDEKGTLCTLRFLADPQQPELHILMRHEGKADAQFIREHGLVQDERYLRQEIIDIVENYGMTYLPLDETVPAEQRSRLDAFYIDASVAHPGHPGDPDSLQDAIEPLPVRLLSSFWVVDERIHYVDNDGSRGTLILAVDNQQGPRVRVAADNTPAALAFARSNDIRTDRFYAMPAILAALFRHGYVQTED